MCLNLDLFEENCCICISMTVRIRIVNDKRGISGRINLK